MPRKFRLVLLLLFTCVLALYFCYQENPSFLVSNENDSGHRFHQVAVRAIPNCFEVSEGIYSGGQPDGAIGFENLSKLGIKTIVSVDGAQPDVESAKQFGLKYVHLPHGYDGVDREQAVLLSKAVGELEGPYYIHCHHGKHRSPAAAAVACIGLGILNTDQGMQLLQEAGTSEEYRGLYRSVANAVRFEQTELSFQDANFPERAQGSPLVESMVEIEKHFDAIKRFAENGWSPLPTHPDLDAAHEALLLFEQFAELVRSDTGKQEEYWKLLDHSKEQAFRLHELLSRSEDSGSLDQSDTKRLIHSIKNDCRSCHRKFRD